MKITRLKIQNFRSISELELELGETTVLIGPNNAGKSAILEATRIALSRRWGRKGTGFTENDVHRLSEEDDPRTLPPVTITIYFEEPAAGDWNPDMIAALEDCLAISADGRNQIAVRITCAWNEEDETFDPVWQFLNADGEPLPERRRSINLTSFFSYVPVYWLPALRDASNEFSSRSGRWGGLLRGVRIPVELQQSVIERLRALDNEIIAADPRLSDIAELIGRATHVAIADTPGGARLSMLPMALEELLQRAGIVVRNEDDRPWLPLGHHGQGLQSLSVIFLFQAVALQELAEAEQPGIEPIFAIEEPEVHLHPQAARVLWNTVSALPGQKIMATHSPYFTQHVPLRSVRLVHLNDGCTQVSYPPEWIVSDLPWNESLDGLVAAQGNGIIGKDPTSGLIAAQSWFDEKLEDQIVRCCRGKPGFAGIVDRVAAFRRRCRILLSSKDEADLSFHGRRVRGEVFFARRWILVEGVSEYLLIHAIAKAEGWPLDAHGIAVIDFQFAGSAGIYPSLADAFGIPWHMVTDGDGQFDVFRKNLLTRGFTDEDLTGRLEHLERPNSLERQLIVDGHGKTLRGILARSDKDPILGCNDDELLAHLKNRKTEYIDSLSLMVACDSELAAKMPAPMVGLIRDLKKRRR